MIVTEAVLDSTAPEHLQESRSLPVSNKMFTPSPSEAKVGPDAVATTLCASNTEALVPNAAPCRHLS